MTFLVAVDSTTSCFGDMKATRTASSDIPDLARAKFLFEAAMPFSTFSRSSLLFRTSPRN